MGVRHNNHITIAKAIGIILMVVGHSGCPQLLCNFIYLFHMPLFFICSGLFYREPLSRLDMWATLKKKVRGLYVPFVKWTVAFLLLHNVFVYIGIYNQQYGYDGGSSWYSMGDSIERLSMIIFTMTCDEDLIGGFWFIKALFCAFVLVQFGFYFLRSVRYRSEILFVFFLTITIVVRRFDFQYEQLKDLSTSTLAAAFFIIGFKLKAFFMDGHLRVRLALPALLLLCFALYRYSAGLAMGSGWNKVLPFTITAMAGTALVVSMSELIERYTRVIRGVLYSIGNQTLTILALHFLCFRLVSLIIIRFSNLDLQHLAEHPVVSSAGGVWWVIYSIVGVALPMLIHWLYCKWLNIRKKEYE